MLAKSPEINVKEDELEKLKRMRMEIENDSSEYLPTDKLKKYVKKVEAVPTITFDFEISFDL